MNIALFLEMAAQTAADRPALVCERKTWSYSELLATTHGAAKILRQSNRKHVALLDENSEASAIALFGAALAGLPYVPLNYRLADADLGALLERITPAVIVGDVERVTRLCSSKENHLWSRADFVAAAREADETDETEAAETAEADDEATNQGAQGEGGGLAIQLFTSGTTAAPKAAILRHANLVSYILAAVEFASSSENEAALVSVPPYHIAGIAALLSSIYAQRRLLLLPSFSAQGWLDLAARESATHAFVVPTMLSRIIEKVEKCKTSDLSTIRSLAYGGGKMPMELIRKALDLFPETDFTNAYGLTETSSTIALLSPDEHRAAHTAKDPSSRARLASVGKALPSVEIEIRDENGMPLPSGERGEVHVRGEQVSGEYKQSYALDAEGWFATRDTGYIDQEGYLFLAGRADDVIVRGGENISPAEIEDVLLSHSAIADVAAVAIPSLEWGETVGVALVTRKDHQQPSESEIKHLVRARLRSSRVPEKILFAAALPYNEMGKLLRRAIKTMFAD